MGTETKTCSPKLYGAFQKLFNANSLGSGVFKPCATSEQCTASELFGRDGWSAETDKTKYGDVEIQKYTKLLWLKNKPYKISVEMRIFDENTKHGIRKRPVYSVQMANLDPELSVRTDAWIECDGTVRGYYDKNRDGLKDLRLMKSALAMIVGFNVRVLADNVPYVRYIHLPFIGDISLWEFVQTDEVR